MNKIKVWQPSHTLSSEESFFSFKKDPVVLHRVKELSKINSTKSLSAVAASWLIMAAAIGFAVAVNHWLAYVLSVILVAGRQHSLFLLVHEGTHQRLLKKPFWNDLVSNFFCAYPIFIDTDTYRSNHLSHHHNLNSDKDPDWVRKKDISEWQFPKKSSQAISEYKKYLYGFGVYEIFMTCRFLSGLTRFHRPSRSKSDILIQLSYYGVLSILFISLNLYKEFFLFWIVPGMTVLPIIMRLRSVSEHIGLPHQHELNGTRNVLCSPLERYFIAPFNGSYHLDHHLFPSVPFYNLPQLNGFLSQVEEYKQNAYQNSSYLGPGHSVFNDLIKKNVHLKSVK